MTTNNNNRIPELRFPGFEGEWKETVLSDILRERNEQFPETEEYPLMAFIANVGVAPKGDRYDRGALVKDAKSKKYKRTQLGDFIYSSNNLESGSIGQNNYGNASISPVYSIFEINKKFDSTFIGTLLTKKEFISKMVQYRQGVVYGQWKIHESEFLKLQILVPTLPEQQKIADCLSSLDEEIAAEAQKADALKDHKKGLMQQLFPAISNEQLAMSNEQLAMSNCVPQLRFPGFEGEWVVKKFDELFSLLSNNTCSRADLNESNGIAVNIHYGDVLIKYNEILNIQDTKIPFITESKLVSKYKDSILRDGDIIIADTAEDSTVGKCTEIQNRQQTIILSGLHTIPARPLRKFAKGFLGYIMNSESYHDQLLPLMQGAKVSSISRTAIKKTFICFPTLAEQQKIADCLSELDEMISAQQQKVEALKEHKKGLMQKLFPKMSN